MSHPQTEIEIKGIGEILKSRKLEVPVHQRPFSWTSDEVGEFILDIDTAIEAGADDYFLGSIVAKPSAEERFRFTLLDGQQRLATTTVILNEIARKLTALGDSKRATAIRQDFISKVDLATGDELPQFKLNSEDDPFFRLILAGGPAALQPGAPESHSRLKALQEEAQKWIERRASSAKDGVKELVRIAQFLRDSASAIYFAVPDDADAYLIFETLNDRGLELSIADLLKNYLLGHAGSHVNEVLTAWTSAIMALRTEGGDASFTKFLRHYWSSKYEVVRERHIYRGVKARISSPPNVLDFSKELANNSFHYTAIASPEHELWTGVSPEASLNIRTLLVLGLEQFRPMLLSAMSHFKPSDLDRLLRMLISWNVRLLIVGGLGGGVMERHYSELGVAIRKGELQSATEVGKRAKNFVPGDSVFEASVGIARASKPQLTRYYLRTLEVQARGKVEPELVPNPDPSKLTLEHVLPEKTERNWPQFTEDEHSLYQNRLGNLVLLTKRVNSKARSDPFEKKRKLFAESELSLTREVAEFANWTTTSIEERQRKLAKLAVKTWPLNPS